MDTKRVGNIEVKWTTKEKSMYSMISLLLSLDIRKDTCENVSSSYLWVIGLHI